MPLRSRPTSTSCCRLRPEAQDVPADTPSWPFPEHHPPALSYHLAATRNAECCTSLVPIRACDKMRPPFHYSRRFLHPGLLAADSARRRVFPDTTTSSSYSSSGIPVLESPACSCGSPMIPTPSHTSPPSASTLYAAHPAAVERACRLTASQKIRTIDLDGKTVKLQIVRVPFPLPSCPSPGSPSSGGRILQLTYRCLLYLRSGTRPARNVSAPSHRPTTAELMGSASSTMSPTWTASTM